MTGNVTRYEDWTGRIPAEAGDWSDDGFLNDGDKQRWGPKDADEMRHQFRCSGCKLMIERQDYPVEMEYEGRGYVCMSCRLGLDSKIDNTPKVKLNKKGNSK